MLVTCAKLYQTSRWGGGKTGERREKKKMFCLAKQFTVIPGDIAPWWWTQKTRGCVKWWDLELQSYLRARLACLPERLLSSARLRTIQWGSCYTQLFQLCLICPFSIPHPPHLSAVPSFIVPPSWAPFLPPSIRSITELWLSHFNIASGCNTQSLISLLKREGIREIHFPLSKNTPTVQPGVGLQGGTEALCCNLTRKRGQVMGGRAHCRHLLVII